MTRARAALWIVALTAAGIVIGLLPTAAGLVAAPALAALCRPLYDRLRKRIGPRRSALVVTVTLWIVVVVPGAWLGVTAARQVPDGFRAVHRVVAAVRAAPAPLPGVSADTLFARGQSASLQWLSASVGPTLAHVARAVASFSLALLALYFLLVSDDSAWRAVRDRLPFSADGSERLRLVFVDATRATVLGTGTSAALQGMLIGIGLWLTGSTAAAFWGVVAGFATLIPIVGNAVIWVPAVIALLLRHEYKSAVVMIVLGKLIPELVDRVVKIRISRRLGDMHPMVTLLGALAGVGLFGAVGVFTGPALLRSGLEIIELYDREFGVPWAARS